MKTLVKGKELLQYRLYTYITRTYIFIFVTFDVSPERLLLVAIKVVSSGDTHIFGVSQKVLNPVFDSVVVWDVAL